MPQIQQVKAGNQLEKTPGFSNTAAFTKFHIMQLEIKGDRYELLSERL